MRAKLDEHWVYVLEQFENVYPELAEDMIHWYSVGYNEMIVILEDDRRFLYNYTTHNLIPYYDPNNLERQEEEAWRREFSYRLRRKMNDAFVSQERLAEETGISRMSISKYMNGKATPSAYNLEHICKVLKCSTIDLFRR